MGRRLDYTKAHQQAAMSRYGWEPIRPKSWEEELSSKRTKALLREVASLKDGSRAHTGRHRSSRYCRNRSANVALSPDLPRKAIEYKFRQEWSDLKRLVQAIGLPGDWRDLGNLKQFTTGTGAVLNWWPSSGTILFQGTTEAAAKYESLFIKALPQSIFGDQMGE
jgi:hypothetical protein